MSGLERSWRSLCWIPSSWREYSGLKGNVRYAQDHIDKLRAKLRSLNNSWNALSKLHWDVLSGYWEKGLLLCVSCFIFPHAFHDWWESHEQGKADAETWCVMSSLLEVRMLYLLLLSQFLAFFFINESWTSWLMGFYQPILGNTQDSITQDLVQELDFYRMFHCVMWQWWRWF